MYYIGVDIGGTFTDCVLVDSGGRHLTAKALSTRANPVDGVRAALGRLGEQVGSDLPTILAKTSRFSHGTTIGTNAVLERRGARVGLITTAGHGDALAMMRGRGRVAGRPVEQVFEVHGTSLPEPLIMPGAVLELHERVDRTGAVVAALDADRAREKIRAFVRRHELDAVAVTLLWSFVNPAHERRVAELVAEVAPEVYVSSSVDVSPRLGEFERMVATVINGYVGPACSQYLGTLADSLRQEGLATPLLVMQSNGGVLPAAAAAATSLGTIDSGPSGGLTGVSSLARAYGHDRVVATDMGGTSFDIGLVVDGQPVMAEENIVDQYTYRLPHLDVRTVACGGGTLARDDRATGSIRVGPESAGSEPGPACYGRGGTEPTVTDADVVLGLIRPKAFLDGRMPLDADAARAAVGALAERLGLSVEETAAGVVNVNNMRAATLIRQQTIERGQDPRDFVLYAYGGAGPVHAFGFAAEIGVQDVIVPLGDGASTLSAYGIASGDVVRYVEYETAILAPFADDALATAVDDAADAARRALAEAKADGEVTVSVVALMRFQEQLVNSIEIPVALPVGPRTGPRLLEAFQAEYQRRYGAGGTGLFGAAEVFALRAKATIASSVPTVGGASASGPGAGAATDTTEVFWPTQHEWLPTTVFDGPAFAGAGEVRGPALVELAHTTIAVPPEATLSTGPRGELRLRLSAASTAPSMEGTR
ncbi:hydantoinase/oxoprolinase family protein [Amycolatopsis ultiminotia]|uniref:Hydantoinase/oxoprolinase family protein n=1 Tax=Amycolatopsis ultiminotia TaxID=543629 RepID=A0ABP6X5N2_9PSEU